MKSWTTMVQELLHLPQLCSNSQCHYSIFSLQGFNFTQLKVISIDFFVKFSIFSSCTAYLAARTSPTCHVDLLSRVWITVTHVGSCINCVLIVSCLYCCHRAVDESLMVAAVVTPRLHSSDWLLLRPDGRRAVRVPSASSVPLYSVEISWQVTRLSQYCCCCS